MVYNGHKILSSILMSLKSVSLKILVVYAYFSDKLQLIFYILYKSVKPFHVKRFINNHKGLGNSGESVAIKHYEKMGYLIISKNSRTRNSEIDFVAQKAGKILFVEVKTLEIGDTSKLLAEDNFTKNKQFHLKRGIEQYLFKEKPIYTELQIDLACVYYHTAKDVWSIKLYENLILE